MSSVGVQPAVYTLPAREGRGGAVGLRDVSIRFGTFRAVEDVSLDVGPGEFVCLLGPSGCGKSTILNAVAGFIPAARGEVLVDGRPVTRPDVSRGMVFQSTEALFPWLRVRDNVSFGPRMRRISRSRRAELIRYYVDLVGLSQFADRL